MYGYNLGLIVDFLESHFKYDIGLGFEHDKKGVLLRVRLAPRTFLKLYAKPGSKVYLGIYERATCKASVEELDFDSKGIADLKTVLAKYSIMYKHTKGPFELYNRQCYFYHWFGLYDDGFALTFDGNETYCKTIYRNGYKPEEELRFR